jgi:hypothetical protein
MHDETWGKGVAPVRIAAGALGHGLPARALYLSPQHALYIEGRLVEAKRLVNGTTVVQTDHPGADLVYWNIELEGHDLIRANGVLAETFRPSHILAREVFDNFAEFVELYPGEEYCSYAPCAPAEPKAAFGAALTTAIRRQAVGVGLYA